MATNNTRHEDDISTEPAQQRKRSNNRDDKEGGSDVVRSQHIARIPQEKRDKLQVTFRAQQADNRVIDRFPSVEAVYVRNIRRCPLGQLRISLKHSLPLRASGTLLH